MRTASLIQAPDLLAQDLPDGEQVVVRGGDERAVGPRTHVVKLHHVPVDFLRLLVELVHGLLAARGRGFGLEREGAFQALARVADERAHRLLLLALAVAGYAPIAERRREQQ